MSATDLAEFYVHTVSVRPYKGMSGRARTFDPAVTVPCFAQDVRKQVTTSSGDVVISTTSIYCDPQYAALFPVDSEVTTDDTTATVVRLTRNLSGALDLPDHLEIYLS